MKYCPLCGTPLEEGQKFCTYCGATLNEDSAVPRNDAGPSSQQSTTQESAIQESAAEQQPSVGQQQPSVEQYRYERYDYSMPQYTHSKKKSGAASKIIIGVIVAIVVFAAAALIIGLAFDNYDPKQSLEYDSGFENVIVEEADGYTTYTPVMKEGYIFDYWTLGGVRYDQKILTLTSGYANVKGYSTAGYTVTVYSMYGVSISYDGERKNGDYLLGETAKIYADDDVNKFLGWYSADGTLLSTSDTYVVPQKSNVTILAKTTSTKYNGDSSLKVDLSEMSMDPAKSSWIILDGKLAVGWDSGTSIDLKVNPGNYKIIVTGKNTSGTDETKTVEKEITGTYKLSYSWKYDNKYYGFTWTVPYDTYKASKNNTDLSRSPSSSDDRARYVMTDLPDSDVVAHLTNITKTMTEKERANCVLKFVQECFWYQYDTDYNGRSEYWKYPLETMVDQRGDCEDTAILYCNLMRAMGYDVALLLFEGVYYMDNGHAASGLCLTTAIPGTTFTVGGKSYYYCETTNDSDVGEAPKDYTTNCNVIPIPAKT